MKKEYVIDYEAVNEYNDCIRGEFNEKTVVKEVRKYLESRYGDRLKWFFIKEYTPCGLEDIYDSSCDKYFNSLKQ